MPQLLAACRELEVVWLGFQVEDNAVLCEFGLSEEYSSATIVETGRLVNYTRSVSDQYEAVNNVHSCSSDVGSVVISLIFNRGGVTYSN